VLDWKPASLLNLIIKRVLNNDVPVTEFTIDSASVLRNFQAQNDLFYRFFPKQVEQGTKKRTTLDWVISRCADASGRTAPRELIHLFNSVREQEVARIERGEPSPEGDQLFDHTVFKPALATVSHARLVQTIYAEYPDLKSGLTELLGEKTEQTIDSLGSIWKLSATQTKNACRPWSRLVFFKSGDRAMIGHIGCRSSIGTPCS
jgi:hypothetical protein